MDSKRAASTTLSNAVIAFSSRLFEKESAQEGDDHAELPSFLSLLIRPTRGLFSNTIFPTAL